MRHGWQSGPTDGSKRGWMQCSVVVGVVPRRCDVSEVAM